MSNDKSLEIDCPACGRETLLMRRPKYEGFKKTGELLSCASCGHQFAGEEEVPFKGKKVVKVFTDADRSKDVKVFESGEADRLCLNCANYVVNPFVQWCAHHRKEVEATDTCSAFVRKPEPKASV
jgi:DNA-directed RNA polymerase subunit RPC12/RpoP